VVEDVEFGRRILGDPDGTFAGHLPIALAFGVEKAQIGLLITETLRGSDDDPI